MLVALKSRISIDQLGLAKSRPFFVIGIPSSNKAPNDSHSKSKSLESTISYIPGRLSPEQNTESFLASKSADHGLDKPAKRYQLLADQSTY